MLLLSTLAMLRPYQLSLIYQLSFTKDNQQHGLGFDMMAEIDMKIDTKKAAEIAKSSKSHFDRHIYHLVTVRSR